MKNGDIVILDKGFSNESEVQVKANFDKTYCLVNNIETPNIGWFVMSSRLSPKVL
jgi:hypothetical protein